MNHEEWISWVHQELPCPNVPKDAPIVLDLFAGCGGLALPFEVCGFRTIGYEMNQAAVETYQKNLSGECHQEILKIGRPDEKAELIIGGPPCQPFSQFGYQRGMWDSRDGFPIFLDAVKRINPKIAILENVNGLLFRNKTYLRDIIQEIKFLGYCVDVEIMNSSDFGVPQKRKRLIIIASRIGWKWPKSTVDIPITAGSALGSLARHEDSNSKYLTPEMDRYIAKYEKKSGLINPRDLHLDKPARTVTCRNLGGATSDMLRLRVPSGKRRRLTVREGARLQGFPDWFEFYGTESEQFKQIGNAVPPLLALALARQAKDVISNPSNYSAELKMNAHKLGLDRISVKVDEALSMLKQVGIPLRKLTKRRRERVAKALLAVSNIKPEMPWSEATSYYTDNHKPITTREIIRFWNKYYGENIADSSYDDVRRKDLIYLVESGFVARSAADPTADVNDGTRGYSLTTEALELLHSYGSLSWETQLLRFRENAGSLADRLSKAREFNMIPVTLPDGSSYRLSPGPHNVIQRAIIEDFLPRFSKGSQVLYLGDTSQKLVHVDEESLRVLGVDTPSRRTLPDVIAYEEERNWMFLIEAVHSSNPINELRHLELRRMVSKSTAGCLFVSAFANTKTFARFSKQIGWETEVWIADDPDHMIHFDGGRFLKPYDTPS